MPQEWADKYKGQFDDGWDAYREKVFARQKELGVIPADAQLSRHDPDVKPWETCTPEERKVYARMMEVYAGFLEHTDYHIGRLLDFLKRIDAYDDTLIIAVSDNGASSEGGPNGMININMWHNNLPGTVEDNLSGAGRAGRTGTFQPLRLGLDIRRQHAFPALEARDLSRRHFRPAHRTLACQHRRRRTPCGTSTFMPSTLCQRCSTAWASSRRRPSAA